MFANTALAAVCAGAALLLLLFKRPLTTLGGTLLGAFVALLGGATLIQHLSRVDLGIDRLLLEPAWGAKAAAAPGRMGPPASVSYTLLGIALILIASRGAAMRRIAPRLGISVSVIAALALLGYLFGADPLFAVVRYTGIALQTATVLLALALGVIASVPECEPVRTLQRDTGAGAFMRHSLPFIIVLPVILGWLRVRGQTAGYYDTAMGSALMSLAHIGILCGLVAWWASGLARYEAALRHGERLQRLLAQIGELGARLPGADELVGAVCERVAVELGVSRCGYSRVDLDSGRYVVVKDYASGLPSLSGAYCNSPRLESNEAGVVVMDDLATNPHSAGFYAELWAPLEIRASLSVPLHREGRLAANFWVSHHQPRRWTAPEIELIKLIADRVWIVVERLRAEQALREAQNKLQLHADDLEATVAVRTAQLQYTIDELQSFSYSIAHDMRAPLRAMGTFAQLLMQELPTGRNAPELRDYCERIVLGAARLDNLIRDALNYTKTALQEFPVQPVDLSKLVRGLLDTYPNLHSGSADIRFEGALPVVLGNESMLTQCFSNLLGNAVKFVAPGVRPNVRLWSEPGDRVVRIWIEDNGIGIPRHAQPRLFAMFQKLDNQYDGTGIGLAIVRKVVERMGGKVGVESELQQGSRFWIELPLQTTPERA